MQFVREASPERIAILLVFVAVAVLLYLLQLPLIARRIRPNLGYGLRVPATLADESVWYDANEATGRDLRRVAVGCAALAVIGFLAPIADEVFGLGMASALVAALVSAAIVGWRRANRMLRALRSPRI